MLAIHDILESAHKDPLRQELRHHVNTLEVDYSRSVDVLDVLHVRMVEIPKKLAGIKLLSVVH